MDESMEFLPTTNEYWTVDGLVLNTYAWNIASWGDGRRRVPSLRGENVVIPHRPGETYSTKIAESQTVTLGMWVLGCNADGTVAAERRGQFNSNWQRLYRHMWRPDRQVELERRTMLEDGSIYVDRAQAEFVGGLEPSMEGPQGARFTVDFKLADPYFYGPTNRAHVIAGENLVVANDSDDMVRKLVLTFTNGSDYTLTNETTGKSITINESGTVVVDTDLFTAVDDDGVSVLGSLETNFAQTSSAFWMTLATGFNTLSLSSGYCDVEWKTIRL